MIDLSWVPVYWTTPERERELAKRAWKLVSRYRGKRKRAKAFRRFMRFIRNRPKPEEKTQQMAA